MVKKITISAKERKSYLIEGVNFIMDHDPTFFEEAAENHVNDVIEWCIDPMAYGWKTAPSVFRRRFEIKMGMDKKKKNAKFNSGKKAIIIAASKTYKPDATLAKNIIDIGVFSKEEESRIRQKSREYQADFVFNSTSDKHLLMNLIIEEIKLDRLNKEYFASDTVSKQSIDARRFCQGNILKFQEALNITRKQRDSELEKGAKSIAELSKSLEAKMDEWSDAETLQYEEELQFNKERLSREPMNLPLSVEEMEIVLSGSEKEDLGGEELVITKQLADHHKQQEKIKLADSIRKE